NTCTNNKQFGVTDLDDYGGDPGTTTGVQYLEPDGIDCCGVIDSFDATYERTGCGHDNQGNERITVLPGDLYGWWTAGQEIIRYDDATNTVYEKQLTGSPAVGREESWPVTWGTTTNRRYGISVQVDQIELSVRPSVSQSVSQSVNDFLTTLNITLIANRNLKKMEARAGESIKKISTASYNKAAIDAYEKEME
ncbi:hypothetical protein DPMN_080208, partial [Dreissena polymorpha]